MLTEGPWTVTGAIAAIIGASMVVIFGIYEFVWLPLRRRQHLRPPAKRGFA
jgi:hypothetical protein